MNQLVKIDPKEYGLEVKQAKSISSGLDQVLIERTALAARYSEVIKLEITEENIPTFKELRLKIRDNRTKGIEPWHKAQKEFYLRGGQFVDAIKRAEIVENERMENNLKEMEDFFENQEKERKQAIYNTRCAELESYGYDAIGMPLDTMDDDMYALILSGAKEAMLAKKKAEEEERLRVEIENKIKALHETRKEKLLPFWNFVENKSDNFGKLSETEFKKYLKSVEAAYTENERSQEAIRAENARLKAEADRQKEEAEKIKIAERDKSEAEVKSRKEQADAFLSSLGFEFSHDHSGIYRLYLEERKPSVLHYRKTDLYFETDASLTAFKSQVTAEIAKVKLEFELEIKRAEEAAALKEKQNREAKERAAAEELAKAPVKRQLTSWLGSFKAPVFTGDVDNEAYRDIVDKFDKFLAWAGKKVNEI